MIRIFCAVCAMLFSVACFAGDGLPPRFTLSFDATISLEDTVYLHEFTIGRDIHSKIITWTETIAPMTACSGSSMTPTMLNIGTGGDLRFQTVGENQLKVTWKNIYVFGAETSDTMAGAETSDTLLIDYKNDDKPCHSDGCFDVLHVTALAGSAIGTNFITKKPVAGTYSLHPGALVCAIKFGEYQ